LKASHAPTSWLHFFCIEFKGILHALSTLLDAGKTSERVPSRAPKATGRKGGELHVSLLTENHRDACYPITYHRATRRYSRCSLLRSSKPARKDERAPCSDQTSLVARRFARACHEGPIVALPLLPERPPNERGLRSGPANGSSSANGSRGARQTGEDIHNPRGFCSNL
jgi:hypothetical protein